MNTPLPDLGDLLRDAVDEIEPADRIEAIRARAAAAPTRAARPWFYAAGGVVLATAAAVAAFAVLDDSPPPDHETMVMPADTQVVPAYFLGQTRDGFRLFREFDTVPAGDPLQAALDRIQEPPTDPDYQTLWPHGSLVSASVRQGVIEVEVDDNAPSIFAGVVEGLPEQQVVYTLQGVLGQRLPVQFVHGGRATRTTLEADRAALNGVLVSDPAEGREVHDRFTARGATPSGGSVRWELRQDDGTVVKQGVTTARRSWHARVDVAGLPFGFYTFVASAGPDSDTRTIIVR